MKVKAAHNEGKIYALIITGLLIFLMISLIATVQLAVTNSRIQNKKEKIVVPMAFNSPFIVSGENMSATYQQQIAMSFLPMRLNVSPESVQRKHEFLLQWVRPASRPEMKVILDKEAAQIKDNAVSSSFSAEAFRVYPDDFTVDISGELTTWIGDSKPMTATATPAITGEIVEAYYSWAYPVGKWGRFPMTLHVLGKDIAWFNRGSEQNVRFTPSPSTVTAEIRRAVR